MKKMRIIVLLFISFVTINTNVFALESLTKSLSLDEMKQIVENASKRVSKWDGPVSGPVGKKGMQIAVVCEDLRNGGVLGVAEGIGEAAKILGWKLKIFDAKGTQNGRIEKLSIALEMDPDGVILVGSDANSLKKQLLQFKKRNIPIVGWHIGAVAGKLSTGSVSVNVSTDPLEVARITAMAAIIESKAKAGVVILTDSNFEIAMKKANAMAEIVKKCTSCTLLELRDLPISSSNELMPNATKEMLKKYGDKWTHALAINDIYFDYASSELTKQGRNIRMFSAGDGSSAAFLRIRVGAFQYGTVAEPLNLQGWQLVDEMNRLLSNQEVSGYIIPVHLVTPQNIMYDGGERMQFDPDNGYREIYRKIWNR